jgi:hypothetical protein
MRLVAPASLSLLTLAASATAWAVERPSSPFAPGGPLEPWQGPVPTAAPAAYTPPAEPPVSSDPYRPRARSPLPPVDADAAHPDADDRTSTYVSVFLNPALAKLGKLTGHLEIAPYGPHALFLEVSRLSLDIQDKGYSVQVKGWEYDVGYHLFPLSRGARGFYIGPRYVRGSGSAEGASGDFNGFGGDLGYQWVFADRIVLNLGAGAMHVSGKARIDPAVLSNQNLPPVESSGFESLSSESGSYLLPLVTLGLGLAI